MYVVVQVLGYDLPFDRHDWIVDRNGKEVSFKFRHGQWSWSKKLRLHHTNNIVNNNNNNIVSNNEQRNALLTRTHC